MISRVRKYKRSLELKVTPKGNFLKIALGKRVWYFELWNVFHSLVSVKDKGDFSIISHECQSHRKTVDRLTAEIVGIY